MNTSGTSTPSAVGILNSSVLQLPDYLPYLELCLNWTALISHGITVVSIGFMILVIHCQSQWLRIQHLASTLLLFLYAHFCFSMLSIPYQMYRVCQWRTPGTYTQNNFSSYTLFWLALPELAYYGTIPSTVFLLAIERCVGIKWPLSLVKRHFWLVMSSTFGIILFMNTAGHLLELPLDTSTVNICETASCTTTDFRLYFQMTSKIGFSCANVCCSIALLLMLRGIDKSAKMKNRVIIFTMVFELLFGVLPCFISILYNQVLNLPIGASNSGLKGEIAITFCAIDGAMCGILYVSVLFKRNPQSTTVVANHAITTAAAGGGAVSKNLHKPTENLPKIS